MLTSLAGSTPLRGVACLAICAAVAPAQERDPEDFVLALGLIRRDLHAEASAKLESFLEEHPRHRRAAEGWYRLGTCRLELGAPAEAIAAFDQALRFRGFELRPECRYRLGTTLLDRGEPERARAQFRALLDEVPEDHYLVAAAHFGEGSALRDLKRDEPALASFLAAARSGDDYRFAGHYQAGFALIRLGRQSDAEELFGALADAYREHEAWAELRYLQGEAAFAQRRFDAAEEAWRDVAQRGASGEYADDALYGAGFCRIEAGDAAGALAAFRAVVQRADSPLRARAMLEVGRLQHRAGEHGAAAATLAAVLEVAGVEPATVIAAHELRGLALIDAGDPRAARGSIEAALAAKPQPAVAARLQFHLGDALGGEGRWVDALAAYARAEAGGDDELRGDAAYAQVLALHKDGRFAESSARAERMLREQPRHRWAPLAAFAIAENQFELRDYEGALRRYDALGADHPKGPEARFKAAFAAFLAGDPAAAAGRFEAVAADEAQRAELREEALSMQALCLFEAGDGPAALAVADVYRARHGEGGRYLERTERIAARVLRAQGDLPGAAARLRVAAAHAGDGAGRAGLEIEQGDVLFERGDFAGARTAYAALAGRGDRTGARAIEGLAWCAFELGDEDACLAAIERGLAHPQAGEEAAGLLELRATVHHRGERWTEAAAAAAEHLRRFPTHARRHELRYVLGVAQARGGELAAARTTLAGLAAEVAAGGADVERPDRVFYELAWACRRGGDEAAALQAFAVVATRSADADLRGEALLHLDEARLAAGAAGEAVDLFAKVEGSHRARASYRRGFALQDRPAAAAAAFEEVAAMGDGEPLRDEAAFMAGECRLRAGDPAAAAPHLEGLLERAPEHARAQRARLYLGECLVRNGRAEDAVGYLAEFVQRGADAAAVERARAALWLGKAELDRGDAAAAVPALKRTTELSEGELAAEAQYLIGEAHARRGDGTAALGAWLELAILYEHAEWVPRGLLRASEVAAELEQPDKADKLLRELIARFPDSAEAEQARERVRGQ